MEKSPSFTTLSYSVGVWVRNSGSFSDIRLLQGHFQLHLNLRNWNLVRKLDLMRFSPNLIGPWWRDKNWKSMGTTLQGWEGPCSLATLSGVPPPHNEVTMYG